jgi:hypothetical protein
MAFINEFVSPADVEKYGLKEINRQYRMLDEGTDWTVDVERDIYIRRISQRGPSDGSVYFHMYWRGTVFRVFILRLGNARLGLRGMELPQELESFRTQILADLKEALAVHGDAGMYSVAKDLKITFDF